MLRHTQTLGLDWLRALAHGSSHLLESSSQLATSLPFKAPGRIAGSLSTAPKHPTFMLITALTTPRGSHLFVCLSPWLHQDSTGRGSPLPHLQAPRQSLPQGFRLTGTELSSQGAGLPSLPMMSWARRAQLSVATLHCIASSLYYPCILDSVALHWSMVNLPEATFLKSTVLPRSSPCCAVPGFGLA